MSDLTWESIVIITLSIIVVLLLIFVLLWKCGAFSSRLTFPEAETRSDVIEHTLPQQDAYPEYNK